LGPGDIRRRTGDDERATMNGRRRTGDDERATMNGALPSIETSG
jgi:hypothetical protein